MAGFRLFSRRRPVGRRLAVRHPDYRPVDPQLADHRQLAGRRLKVYHPDRYSLPPYAVRDVCGARVFSSGLPFRGSGG